MNLDGTFVGNSYPQMPTKLGPREISLIYKFTNKLDIDIFHQVLSNGSPEKYKLG